MGVWANLPRPEKREQGPRKTYVGTVNVIGHPLGISRGGRLMIEGLNVPGVGKERD